MRARAGGRRSRRACMKLACLCGCVSVCACVVLRARSCPGEYARVRACVHACLSDRPACTACLHCLDLPVCLPARMPLRVQICMHASKLVRTFVRLWVCTQVSLTCLMLRRIASDPRANSEAPLTESWSICCPDLHCAYMQAEQALDGGTINWLHAHFL